MFNWLKKLNKRKMENKSKKYDDSLCYHCSKHRNCIYEDGVPIVRCPEAVQNE